MENLSKVFALYIVHCTWRDLFHTAMTKSNMKKYQHWTMSFSLLCLDFVFFSSGRRKISNIFLGHKPQKSHWTLQEKSYYIYNIKRINHIPKRSIGNIVQNVNLNIEILGILYPVWNSQSHLAILNLFQTIVMSFVLVRHFCGIFSYFLPLGVSFVVFSYILLLPLF